MQFTFQYFVMGAVALVAVAALSIFVARPLLAARRKERLEAARKLFHMQRERLEARFVQMAGSSGKPRGLRWVDCDFSDDVTFARDRNTRALSAFVAVTISFEAIDGGGMEDVEAVSNLRAATSVFHFDGQNWITQGRVIMNLEPTEAIEKFRHALELMGD